jgi:hypothetical protein
MKYTLKSLFQLTLFVAVSLAIFLRPIRGLVEANWLPFVDGFILPFYWALWLCYQEGLVAHISFNDNGYFMSGVITSFIMQLLIFMYCLLSILYRVIFGKFKLIPMP